MTMIELVSYGGKRVWVTGAASGVGATPVRILQGAGAKHITTIDVKPGGSVDQPIAANLSTPTHSAARSPKSMVRWMSCSIILASRPLPPDVAIAVNVLAPKRLTTALLDKMPVENAVVNTASIAGGRYPAHLGLIQDLLALNGWDGALTWARNHPELTTNPYGFSKNALRSSPCK
jgi:NAD(P)-dependent dehydrogenase (short-subunit alcohol dehydrogenase family)